VAAGFEHSIANMYYVPYALLIKAFDPAFVVAHKIDLSSLTWGSFFKRISFRSHWGTSSVEYPGCHYVLVHLLRERKRNNLLLHFRVGEN